MKERFDYHKVNGGWAIFDCLRMRVVRVFTSAYEAARIVNQWNHQNSVWNRCPFIQD